MYLQNNFKLVNTATSVFHGNRLTTPYQYFLVKVDTVISMCYGNIRLLW